MNALTLENASRDSWNQANTQFFKSSELLIAIAFGVSALESALILNREGGNKLFYPKWSLFFFGLSVAFGFVQMILDRRFFREQASLLRDAADAWKNYAFNSEDSDSEMAAKSSLDVLARAPSSSSEVPSYLQLTFVVLGIIFIAFEVLQH